MWWFPSEREWERDGELYTTHECRHYEQKQAGPQVCTPVKPTKCGVSVGCFLSAHLSWGIVYSWVVINLIGYDNNKTKPWAYWIRISRAGTYESVFWTSTSVILTLGKCWCALSFLTPPALCGHWRHRCLFGSSLCLLSGSGEPIFASCVDHLALCSPDCAFYPSPPLPASAKATIN